MKTNVLTKAFMGAVLMAAMCSCEQKEQKVDTGAADKLYRELMSEAKNYSDSLKSAKDSAAVFRAEQAYEERVTKKSLAVPPQTDLLLSEVQNDTLYVVMQRLIKLKNVRLKQLANRPDTTTTKD